MKLRKIIIYVILISFLFGLYSCKREEPKETNMSASQEETEETKGTFDFTPESTKLTVWLDTNDVNDPSLNAFIRDNPEFEVDNSTTVTWGFDLDRTKDLPRLGGAIASNEPPDLFLGYMTPLEGYYSNMFIPLDDFYQNDQEYNIADIDVSAMQGVTFNDSIYFIPNNYTVPILVWNKELFENVGLDPEKPPKTWSEMKDYSEKLLTYDSSGKINTIGVYAKGAYLDWKNWNITACGEHFTDKSGLTVNLDTPSYNKTLEFVRSLQESYGGYDKLPSGEGFDFVFSAKAGMGTWSASGVPVLVAWTNFKFGISTLPKPDDLEEEYIPGVIDSFLGIPKNAKNPRGAWKYGKFLMTTAKYESQLNQYQQNPDRFFPEYVTHIPTRKSLNDYFKPFLSDETWELINKRDDIMQKANTYMYDFAEQAQFFNYYRAPYDEFESYKISPKEFLSNAQAYCESIIKSFKERKIGEGWVFNEDGTSIPPSTD